jgi:hypothetical protein
MKKYLYILLYTTTICSASTGVFAQGCVAVRQMGGVNPLSSNGYTLPKREIQVGLNYRYFHSFRHFVGTEEKAFRQNTQGGFDENGKEKGNAVNIYSHAVDLNITYGISDRFQVNVAIPYVHNERSQVLRVATSGTIMIEGQSVAHVSEGIRYSVFAQGLGDIRVSGNYWLFNPETAKKGNLLLGLGIKTNSGSHSKKDEAITLNAAKEVVKEVQMMDQAIQPGDGGIGFSVELQGFRQVYGGVYAFANGYYLFNPRESNGSFKSAPTVVKNPETQEEIGTLTGYNIYASPDQYFIRGGFMSSFGKTKNITLSLAGRFEGIPAYDVFGGQVAYRRPGYVVAIEPGIAYRKGMHSVSLFVPFNFIRNRIQSAADIANQNMQNAAISDASNKVHVQGDAAFADHSINLGYSYRLGRIF